MRMGLLIIVCVSMWAWLAKSFTSRADERGRGPASIRRRARLALDPHHDRARRRLRADLDPPVRLPRPAQPDTRKSSPVRVRDAACRRRARTAVGEVLSRRDDLPAL